MAVENILLFLEVADDNEKIRKMENNFLKVKA